MRLFPQWVVEVFRDVLFFRSSNLLIQAAVTVAVTCTWQRSSPVAVSVDVLSGYSPHTVPGCWILAAFLASDLIFTPEIKYLSRYILTYIINL